jgi:hypothetical protein
MVEVRETIDTLEKYATSLREQADKQAETIASFETTIWKLALKPWVIDDGGDREWALNVWETIQPCAPLLPDELLRSIQQLAGKMPDKEVSSDE